MTGEHFSSATGKELDKSKDVYIRIRWEEKYKQQKPVQTVLEIERVQKDVDLSKMLERFSKSTEDACTFCGNEPTWPLIEFELYNYPEPNTEKTIFAHEKCLDGKIIKIKLETLKLLGKNPTFNIELNCLSVGSCSFFSKGDDFRNCSHITFRFEEIEENNQDGTVTVAMSPNLYCKRAHPGRFFLESEADIWWNVEAAGQILTAKRVEDSLNTPEVQAELSRLQKQHPELIDACKKFQETSPLAALSIQLVVNKFIEQTWKKVWAQIQEGNDYY